MAFDRSEFETAQERRREARRDAQGEVAVSNMLRMAAVSMDLLTNSEEWDAYLKFVSARLETSRAGRAATIEAIASPNLVNHEEILQLKIRLAIYDGEIATAEALMKIPIDIITAARGPADG